MASELGTLWGWRKGEWGGRRVQLKPLGWFVSAVQAEQVGAPVSISVPQVQLINPENQIVEVSGFPCPPTSPPPHLPLSDLTALLFLRLMGP